MKKLLVALLFLSGCFSDIPYDDDACLYLKRCKDSAKVMLVNYVPVGGVMFTVAGCEIYSADTTIRTEGFLCKYNPRNGMVVLVSLEGRVITTGRGAILVLEFYADCGEPVLQDIKISQ